MIPRSVTERIPAKINLELRVGPPRGDGFHELATVFQAISLFDRVTVTETGPGSSGIAVSVVGARRAGVPADDSNLAVRAVRLLAERAGREPAVAVQIDKQIPVAGGMAGGSADGAAALLACNTLWRTGFGLETLLDLAGELGSDVPFALLGGTALGTGRGERLRRLPSRGEYTWVIAVNESGLSTPKVFGELDRLRTGESVPDPAPSAALADALAAGDHAGVAANLVNDMQPAALSLLPSLAEVLDAGRRAGALASMVSGSGPTVVHLVAPADAPRVAEQVRTAPGVREVLIATSPAGTPNPA